MHASGMKIVPVKNEAKGAIDMVDLKAQCEKHADKLAAIMVRSLACPALPLFSLGLPACR